MSTRDLARIALFAAITAALGLLPPIVVPGLPVPITAQTLGVMLSGAIIGAQRGGLSQLTFIVLVAAGLPLLAGGRGGLGVFLGPTGGFALGFPLGAFVIGLLAGAGQTGQSWLRLGAAVVVGGIGVVYAIGIPWLAIVGGLSIGEATIGSLAFLPGDLMKAAIATSVARTVRRSYPEPITS
jgi:biotin transport system substrate-specific component